MSFPSLLPTGRNIAQKGNLCYDSRTVLHRQISCDRAALQLKGCVSMKRFSRFLPVLIVLLALVWFFLPSESSDGLTSAPALDSSVTADSQELQAVPVSSGKHDTGKNAAQSPAGSSGSDAEYTLEESSAQLDEDGSYTTKEDVCNYLIQYGHLPYNFISKKDARDAGWSGGSLEKVLPGMCIGGDYFGNYEGLLPKAKGRKWTECDINTLGKKSRGAERIIFSNDGLIYYTGDHYESFELLYGEP